MSLYVRSILFCAFLVVSSANSQNQWNVQQMKTEIIKMNVKFSYVIDEIDQLKASLGQESFDQEEQLIEEIWVDLNQSKVMAEELKNEIYVIKEELRKLKAKNEILEKSIATSQVNNPNPGQVRADQLIERLSVDLKQTQQKNEATNQQLELLKKEMNELSKKNGIIEQSIFLAKYHEENRKVREEVMKNEMDTVNKELSRLNESEKMLEKSVLLTKPHLYFRLSDDYYKKPADYTWTIRGMLNEKKKTEFQLLSEVFPLTGYPAKAQVKLARVNNGLFLSLAFKEMAENGTGSGLEPIPSVHFTFKDGKDVNKPTIMRYSYHGFKSQLKNDEFGFDRWAMSTEWVVHDSMVIDVHVEGPWVSRQAYSRDGSLTWAVHDFRNKRTMENEDLVLEQPSPYFYTAPLGCRVQALLRLNGFGEIAGKGIRVIIIFLSGPYDRALGPSFPHRTTVTLLHPSDPSKHIAKSVDENIDDQYYYYIDIPASHEHIDQLLLNGALYYHIDIVGI